MAGNSGVACPSCGAPLEVALQVQVEARLTRRRDGKYGIGAIRQSTGEVRRRLEHEHGWPDGALYLDGDDAEGRPEGEVVFCSRRCGFSGTVTNDGIEQ